MDTQEQGIPITIHLEVDGKVIAEQVRTISPEDWQQCQSGLLSQMSMWYQPEAYEVQRPGLWQRLKHWLKDRL